MGTDAAPARQKIKSIAHTSRTYATCAAWNCVLRVNLLSATQHMLQTGAVFYMNCDVFTFSSCITIFVYAKRGFSRLFFEKLTNA